MGKLAKIFAKAVAAGSQAYGVSGGGMSTESVQYEGMGYDDAIQYFAEVFDFTLWHNVELDEEDVPGNNDPVLMAFRDETRDKGYSYRIGSFEKEAAGWKELRYTDLEAREEKLKEDYLEKNLARIREEIPNVLDFSPIRASYIDGFNSAIMEMKKRIQTYKWHSISEVEDKVYKMQEYVLAVSEKDGKEEFAVVEDKELFAEDAAVKYKAWTNIEEFENMLDMV